MAEKFMFGGVEYTLPSPNGLVFQSNAGAYQLFVRDERGIYDHGIRIGTERELVAEFGDMDAPAIHDVEGEYGAAGETYFSVRGHFIDTKAQGDRKGWSDEERAVVEKKLLVTQDPAEGHWLHTKAPAPKPWPTYDETLAAEIPTLAATLGLVGEAAEYERENKARKTVLAGLVVPEPEVEEAVAIEAA